MELGNFLKDDVDKAEFESALDTEIKMRLSNMDKLAADKLINECRGLKSAFDSKVNKAVDSYRDNSLPDYVKREGYAKLETLEPVFQLAKGLLGEREKINLKKFALKQAADGKMSPELALEAVENHDDEEGLQRLVNLLEDEVKDRLGNEIAKRFTGDPPKSGDSPRPKLKDMSEAQLQKLSIGMFDRLMQEERVEFGIIKKPKADAWGWRE